jgi:hypothetical protein
MKEVLGFANSGGGTLAYVVATLPSELGSIAGEAGSRADPTVTVEWIQQMINSNSAPRISDVQDCIINIINDDAWAR